jgi:hypothetical protein
LASKKISKKDQETLNQCVRCAFLCAVGDTELADEEREDLQGGIQSALQSIHHYRKAIESFDKTGNFEASLKLKGSEPIILINGSHMMFDGLPPFLDDVFEQRGAVKNVEELIALEKSEASKITDPFFQKLAMLTCEMVCDNDGEVSPGELVSIKNMCEIWELDYWDVLAWQDNIIMPIITEEELPKAKHSDEAVNLLNKLSEIIGTVLDESYDVGEGEDTLSDEADGDSTKKNAENLLPIDSKNNSFKQGMACVYCCAFGSGDLSQDESDCLMAASNSLSDLYFWPEDEDSPLDLAIESADAVLNGFLGMDSYELGDTLSSDVIVKNITKISKKITDSNLQLIILYLGRAVAEFDGLDSDEETVIESLRASWKHEWKEIDEAFSKLQ